MQSWCGCVSHPTLYPSNRATSSAPGYKCPRCAARLCEVPSDCCICGTALASASHLARSYHHLFPIPAYTVLGANEAQTPTQTAQTKPGPRNAAITETSSAMSDAADSGTTSTSTSASTSTGGPGTEDAVSQFPAASAATSIAATSIAAVSCFSCHSPIDQAEALATVCPLCSCIFCIDCDEVVHLGYVIFSVLNCFQKCCCHGVCVCVYCELNRLSRSSILHADCTTARDAFPSRCPPLRPPVPLTAAASGGTSMGRLPMGRE